MDGMAVICRTAAWGIEMGEIRSGLRRIRDAARVLFGSAYAVSKHTNNEKKQKADYLCPVCTAQISRFLPLSDYYHQNLDKYGFIHSPYLSETMNRLAYQCPKCGASDRSRLYAIYLARYPGEAARFLDIAPAAHLTKFIKQLPWVTEYRSADLKMKDVDDIIDLTNMTIYEDNSFDFFLCSHVLEHVEDDTRALGELYRILKPGGKGIAMVPINLGLSEDHEDPTKATPEERWKHFGQDDHVRLYSKPGFVAKLIGAGFLVNQFDVDHFGIDTFQRHGIHPRSVLYVVEK